MVKVKISNGDGYCPMVSNEIKQLVLLHWEAALSLQVVFIDVSIEITYITAAHR